MGSTEILRYALDGRWTGRRGVTLVRIVCRGCGKRAASVEWRGRPRGLVVVVGKRRRIGTRAVACTTCGPLAVSWDELEAKAGEAVPPGPPVDAAGIVPVSLRAKPRSTP